MTDEREIQIRRDALSKRQQGLCESLDPDGCALCNDMEATDTAYLIGLLDKERELGDRLYEALRPDLLRAGILPGLVAEEKP